MMQKIVMRTCALLLTLALTAASAVAMPPRELVKITSANTNLIEKSPWTLKNMKVDGKVVAIPEGIKVTANFATGGSIKGFSGVNAYFGSYKLDAKGVLTWPRGMGMTRRAGPPHLNKLESTYIQALPKTSSMALIGKTTLALSSKNRKTHLIFAATATAPKRELITATNLKQVTMATWKLKSMQIDGKATELPVGHRATLVLLPGNKVRGNTGVNAFFGACAITAEGTLSWKPFGQTQKAGAPQMMTLERNYLKTLATTAAMHAVGQTTLELTNAKGTTRLAFERQKGKKPKIRHPLGGHGTW
jgi:heat shock protein HslJ